MVPLSKSGVVQATVGSNPTLSVSRRLSKLLRRFDFVLPMLEGVRRPRFSPVLDG